MIRRLLPLLLLASTLARAAAPGWELVWADEFDRPGAPDPTKWSYDVGGHGWGNRELQFYTADRRENARVEDGHLVIEARREKWEGSDYTSARLVTKNQGDWTYGRFEIRARVPAGRGTWPAIWMLPTTWDLGDGKWPDNGEIDIMEHVGHDEGVVHGSLHCHSFQWRKGTQRTGKVSLPEATSRFHTYVLEWEEREVRMFVDDRLFFTAKHEGPDDWKAWPFNRPFHLILNIAVGGDWGGEKGVDPAVFPRRMEIDFVRVYRRSPAPRS